MLIYFQFHCDFDNSCGRCIQLANLIGPWWPLPMHRRCRCRNVPVGPGEEARPFVDFEAEVRRLKPAQQARVMGQASWRLVESKTVAWGDVVTRGRIRTFREVVDRLDLSAAQLTKAGVPSGIAKRALASTQTPAATASDSARAFLVECLVAQGFGVDLLRNEIKRDLARRIGVRLPPSTPLAPKSGPSPSPKTLPGLARLAIPATVAAVATYLGAKLVLDTTEKAP